MASPCATGAAVGACSCTAHSWLDASFTAKRIASGKGCPVTGIAFASAALALSPMILNAPIPAPPSRSTRGRFAMRAFAASCTGFGWLSAAGAVAAAAAAVVGVPTATGGGAVRLMQPATPAARAASKQSRSMNLGMRPRVAGSRALAIRRVSRQIDDNAAVFSPGTNVRRSSMRSRISRALPIAGATIFVAGCMVAATGPGPAYPAPGLEWNVDRPGSDYRSFDLPAPNPEMCQLTCMNEPQCAAFTYMNPGVQGPNARCWLKNAVPQPVPQTCCVSGSKYASPPPAAVAPEPPPPAPAAPPPSSGWQGTPTTPPPAPAPAQQPPSAWQGTP